MMEENNNVKKYIREQAMKEVIMKYLFIKRMQDKYGLDYINKLYKINSQSIIYMYNSLDKEEVKNIEEQILAQIDNGDIDLETEAARWHREGLKRERNEDQEEKEAHR